mmetsp:Transcript_23643/g.29790  ORF Transcript_23643/g.29790 Transcript_23643/m.29790 type:complete len:226 (+) Transcript_23643:89-766(+)
MYLSSKLRFQGGLGLLLLICISLHKQIADACMCTDKGLHQSYFNDDRVMMKVRILGGTAFDGKKEVNRKRIRVAKVLMDYKNETNTDEYILITSDTTSCGVVFAKKGTWFLAMRPVPNGGDKGGLGVYEISYCDFSMHSKSISKEELRYLNTRMICDGKGGSCTCGNKSRPFNCFIDPCESAKCDSIGATCVANYCGGCNAEWIDDRGWLQCECMGKDSGFCPVH